MDDRIQSTWDELGFKVRALRWVLFVRTDPVETRSPGGIWIPPSAALLYNREMPHMRLVTATVLSVGPKVTTVKSGDRVVFKRVHFAWTWKLEDGTYVGWINQEDLVGQPEEAFHQALV